MRILIVMVALCGVVEARPLRAAGWLPEVRARLDTFFCKKRPDHPVATFDWDNTMMKNDIGDITMAWMLRHDALLLPDDWRRTSEALSDGAVAALSAACTGTPKKSLHTSTLPLCADEIFAIYSDGKTAAGAPAWKREITLTTNESYARGRRGSSPDRRRNRRARSRIWPTPRRRPRPSAPRRPSARTKM